MSKSDFSTLQAMQAAFGEHPSDVVSTLSGMAETLLQLAAIFSYLQVDLASNPAVPERARELLRTGADLAGCSADLASGQVEQYRRNLAQAGLLPAG